MKGIMKIRAARFSIFSALILAAIYLIIANSTVSAVDQDVQSQEVDQVSTYVFLPFLASTTSQIQSQSQLLPNGGFEQGLASWQEYSLWGLRSIMSKEELPVQPHSGDWAVWLGGAYNEISGIWQTVDVPAGNPILTFYYWIASEDVCGADSGYDLALVSVNLDEVADSFWLCESANTFGWVRRDVDLSAFAGQNVEIDIVVGTDDYLNSNLFIDDVSFSDSAAVPLDVEGDIQGDAALNSVTKQPSSNGPSKLETNRTDRGDSLTNLLQENRDLGYPPVEK
jgi:hypothetical protein